MLICRKIILLPWRRIFLIMVYNPEPQNKKIQKIK
jgi:hypothetical protein